MVEPELHAVKAARRVLPEIVKLLKDHGASVVVIGGWAADLLPSKAILPHRGTVDIDLVVNTREKPGHNGTDLMEVLASNGYRQGRERFQYYKTVTTDIGPVEVRVDLLSPETEENPAGGNYRTVYGADTLTLRGGELAFTKTQESNLEGEFPNGEKDFVSVEVTSSVPFIILKSLSLWDRRERKDAYDIYHRLKNYPRDLDDLVEEFKPYLEIELVREGLDNLAKCFSDLYSEGPKFTSDFLAPEDPEERDFLKRDSYEIVTFLLEELGIRRPDL
jgi:hypothetical protein